MTSIQWNGNGPKGNIEWPRTSTATFFSLSKSLYKNLIASRFEVECPPIGRRVRLHVDGFADVDLFDSLSRQGLPCVASDWIPCT